MKTAITFVMTVVSVFAAYGKSISLDLRGPVSNSAKVQGLRCTTLAPKSADVGAVAVGDELSLALFDDVKPVLSLKKRMPSSLGGEAFLAEVSGYEGVKNAVVLKTAEGLTVDIQDYRNKKVYKVLSMPSGVKVQELDEVPVSCGCDHVALPKAALEKVAAKKNAANGAVPNGDVVVDILVAFDGNAQAWASSNGGVTNFAILAVQKMNAVLANNNLDLQFRFRLVGVVCVSATSYDLTETLEGAANGYPGWEAIPAKRDAVGADVVTVLIDTGTAYGTTGLGFSLDAPDDRPELKTDISWFSEMAYNVCLIRSVSASQTMTHEVGHNMGCGHSDIQESSPGPQLYDYSSGYYFTAEGERYHTVMAYGTQGPGGTVVPYFSSQDHFYKGVVVGDELHDNRWTIYNTYAGVAQWRSQKASEITKGEDDVPTETLTWYTSRDSAIAKAKAEGKKVFLIYGRDTCWNTQTTKNESCEQNSVKSLLLKDYVCWYSNCDISEQNAESQGYFDSSVGNTLPFIAVIDPASDTALATEGGYHTADALLSMLNNVKPPFTYTLRLHRNYNSGDTATAGRSLTYGVARALPKIQTELKWAPRSGYSFVGWGTSAGATTATYRDGQSVKNLASTEGATVHLYGIWRKSSPSPFTFSGGDWMQEPDGSWRSAAIGDSGRTSASMTVTGPGNLYFLWKASSEVDYDELHFYVDGQEGIADPLSGETGWESLSMDLDTSGPITFKWEYVKDGSQSAGDDCGWIKDVTWTPKAQPAQTYMVVFNPNGGSGGDTRTVADGEAVGVLPSATRDGYALKGWFTTASAGVEVTKDTVVTADVTFYAHWRKNTDPLDPDPETEPLCYELLDEADIDEAYLVPNAVVLAGAAYDGCDVVGIVELKLGKVNAKKGTGKVSGSFITLDGKKHTVKGPKLEGIDGTAPLSVALDVKGVGVMNVTIGGGQFAGSLVGWHVQSANVGGDWTGRGATVTVDASNLSMFAGTVLTDLLPNEEQATLSNGKWSFAKAASVKWAKPKKIEPWQGIYDEESGKGLIVDMSKGTNLSGLKLTYTPKKGTFKGSFKVYELQYGAKNTKLKKYTIKVNGVVVGGVGYGAATSKKPVVSWAFEVR